MELRWDRVARWYEAEVRTETELRTGTNPRFALHRGCTVRRSGGSFWNGVARRRLGAYWSCTVVRSLGSGTVVPPRIHTEQLLLLVNLEYASCHRPASQ